jgi:hypothetical protein
MVEQIYVADIAQLVWEIRRLRRCKASIINLAFRTALEKLAAQFLRDPGQFDYHVARQKNVVDEQCAIRQQSQLSRMALNDFLSADRGQSP